MVELMLSYDPLLRPWGSYPLRMGAYLGLNLGLVFLPLPWMGLPLAGILGLGAWSGVHWGSWLKGLKGFWFFILLGPAVGFPWGSEWTDGLGLLKEWLPSWTSALVLLGILAASHWLTATTTILEIQSGLRFIFSPLGRKNRNLWSLLGSLTLSFLPWTGSRVRGVDQAMALRGVDRKRHPVRWILGLGLPVTLGLLEKSRHTAEALALRSSEMNSPPESSQGF